MRIILTIALLAIASFVAEAQQSQPKPMPMQPAKKTEPLLAPTPASSVTINVSANRGLGLFGRAHQRKADRHQRIADRHQNAADRIAARRGAY